MPSPRQTSSSVKSSATFLLAVESSENYEGELDEEKILAIFSELSTANKNVADEFFDDDVCRDDSITNLIMFVGLLGWKSCQPYVIIIHSYNDVT